jgi:hypothetical protein
MAEELVWTPAETEAQPEKTLQPDPSQPNKDIAQLSPMDQLRQISEEIRENNTALHEAHRKERQLDSKYVEVLHNLPFGAEVTVCGSNIKLHNYKDGREIGRLGPAALFRGVLTEHTQVHPYQMLLVNNGTYVLLIKSEVREKYNIDNIKLPQAEPASQE